MKVFFKAPKHKWYVLLLVIPEGVCLAKNQNKSFFFLTFFGMWKHQSSKVSGTRHKLSVVRKLASSSASQFHHLSHRSINGQCKSSYCDVSFSLLLPWFKKNKNDNHVTRRGGSDPETAYSLADNFSVSLPKIILHSETQSVQD